jgi:mannitol/fructose-specific phosphotransferase system IIA component (Ntr-type)
VVHPGLAIPHIIVEGQNVFEIVLLRCLPGVTFSELHAPVHTAFVLIGSSDERNFHLKALMSVAHLVQEREFEERWKLARNVEQLRDIVLLSKRKRMRKHGKP